MVLIPRILGSVLAAGLLSAAVAAQLPRHHETLGTAAGDEFGHGLAGIGDVDGDGIPDFAVGGRYADFSFVDAGRVSVFSGATGAFLYAVDGDGAGDTLGFVVSGLGDVDLDGVPDWAAGAPRADAPGKLNCGAVKVVSGATGAVLYTLHGAVAGDEFGTGVSGVDDLDLDGVPDLLVGAPFADGLTTLTGEVRAFSGATGAFLFVLPGVDFGSGFGYDVTGLGDLNADGYPEIGVGIPVASPGGLTSAGEVRIYSGIDATLFRTHAGSAAGDQLGRSVADAGDLDGDGTRDLVTGAMRADPNGDSSGLVRTYSGATGALMIEVKGDADSDQLGWSVDAAGDVNGDGQLDFVAGARFSDVGGFDSGYVRVYSGDDGAILLNYEGMQGDNLGWAVSRLGDVNDDGFDDVLVGARYSATAAYNSGAALVIAATGARPYGDDPLGTQTLALEWDHGIAGQMTQGGVYISGALPYTAGVAVLSDSPWQSQTAGIELLVDITPGHFISGNFGFDASGLFLIPVNLAQPTLAGLVFHLQAFAADGTAPFGIVSSNALELLFID
ncbi:MAG: integrin alpha [Planctomycetota bacterium]